MNQPEDFIGEYRPEFVAQVTDGIVETLNEAKAIPIEVASIAHRLLILTTRMISCTNVGKRALDCAQLEVLAFVGTQLPSLGLSPNASLIFSAALLQSALETIQEEFTASEAAAEKFVNGE